jgi:hypothetical protein
MIKTGEYGYIKREVKVKGFLPMNIYKGVKKVTLKKELK